MFSQLILSSDNKKILFTTKNVRLDLDHYATKYHEKVCPKLVQGWLHVIFSKSSLSRLENT